MMVRPREIAILQDRSSVEIYCSIVLKAHFLSIDSLKHNNLIAFQSIANEIELDRLNKDEIGASQDLP